MLHNWVSAHLIAILLSENREPLTNDFFSSAGFKHKRLTDLTLATLFGPTLTDTSCVSIDKNDSIVDAAEICARYLESDVDSILILDDDNPVGIVGGYELLNYLRTNPTRESFHLTKVKEIMLEGIPQISGNTTLKQLLEIWNVSRRAFACIQRDNRSYSPVSARTMLELGIRTDSSIFLSDLKKSKSPITIRRNDTLDQVLDLMFLYKTRKLLLEESNRFLSDRIILSHISKILKLQADMEYILELRVKEFPLGQIHEISENLRFDRLCVLMNKMDHPYIMFKQNGMVLTPWDVCLVLQTFALSDPRSTQAS